MDWLGMGSVPKYERWHNKQPRAGPSLIVQRLPSGSGGVPLRLTTPPHDKRWRPPGMSLDLSLPPSSGEREDTTLAIGNGSKGTNGPSRLSSSATSSATRFSPFASIQPGSRGMIALS